MGKIRITIELDTDAIDGNWGNYTGRAARQLQRAIDGWRVRPALWPEVQHDEWAERPVVVREKGGKLTTIGRFVVDRSDSGWASSCDGLRT